VAPVVTVAAVAAGTGIAADAAAAVAVAASAAIVVPGAKAAVTVRLGRKAIGRPGKREASPNSLRPSSTATTTEI